MDDLEPQECAAQVEVACKRAEAARERADAATRALFAIKGKLTEAAAGWARSPDGFPVAQSLRILADECSNAWRTAADAHEDKSDPAAPSKLHIRAETTYLNIIGALMELVLSPRDGRNSEAAVIRELIENYDEKPGISKTTLEAKFKDAKRSLQSS